MNKVIMMGRLTRDPEMRYGQGQNSTAIASFSIAVDRRFKRDGEPDADFFNCTAFGKQAEFAEKYLKKGTKIVTEGRLQNDTYEKDGEKKTVTKIITDAIEFAESKSSSGSTNDAPKAPSDPNAFVDVPADLDDELPFA